MTNPDSDDWPRGDDQSGLAAIADWGPALDWSDWGDETGESR
jgi:hypothetical protein